MKIIKTHASLIARIAATGTIALVLVVMLLNQPAFQPANPIFAGQVPPAEVMVTSRQADDTDTDPEPEEDQQDEEEKDKDKESTQPTQKNPHKETRSQNSDSSKENDKDNRQNSGNQQKGEDKSSGGTNRGEGQTPGKVEEDPNSDKGNKTGIADRDDPINNEGTGNNGIESGDPTADSTDKPMIVSNLNGHDNPRIITFKELPSGKLDFYAYIANKKANMDLRVKMVNSATTAAGKYITGEGKDYRANLKEGKNTITLYMREKGLAIYHVTYTIRYVPNKADEDDPAVGEHPPVITAYGTSGVNDFSGHIKIPNYIFRVKAETYKGEHLPYDNMKVEFIPEVGNRLVLGTPTGSGLYEYDMFFMSPISGETYKAKVNVTAWDNEGNSSFRSYQMTYEDVGDDQVIGTCEVFIDMTTIGFGVDYSGFKFDVRKGDKASDCILAALEEYGLEPNYSGTPKENFYLRGVTAGLLTYGARIPSTLEHLLVLDGLPPNNGHNRDRLFEFDFTRGSGWMYTIDGVNYPGRGMDRYELTGNETITLRFTLAYGKDLGLTSTAGVTNLSRYCGSWFNGAYHPRHVFRDGGGTLIPGEDCEDGAEIKCWHCQICGKYFMSDDHESIPEGYEGQEVDEPTITLPPGTHDWKEVGRVQPTSESEGRIDYKCSACGATNSEVIPKLEGPEDEGPEDGPGEDTGE